MWTLHQHGKLSPLDLQKQNFAADLFDSVYYIYFRQLGCSLFLLLTGEILLYLRTKKEKICFQICKWANNDTSRATADNSLVSGMEQNWHWGLNHCTSRWQWFWYLFIFFAFWLLLLGIITATQPPPFNSVFSILFIHTNCPHEPPLWAYTRRLS